MQINTPIITIYTTKHCPYSKRLRDWMYDNEISHKEVDITIDIDAVNECFRVSGTISTPVIHIQTGLRVMMLEGYSSENIALLTSMVS